ncbi:hypothetical protein [Pleionea sediminis]|uniref:hypothetical protein n=1 Tax=Pleionea sediminis TaxID=2569479 RepID=UPI001185EF65|nr:hypothetical protein [Pleionea sediminis]
MTDSKVRINQLDDIPSHVKMIMESIKAFAKDGSYSVDELERIMTIALEDGEVDENEKRVLADVLEKAVNVPFDDEVKPYVKALKHLYL